MKGFIFLVIILIANGIAGNDDYRNAKETEQRIAHIAQVDGGK
jgi:hypothetical protein